ncbi:putative membrane protein [Belliella baltica DSM 15883]|uniref:Putative membrane protein n=1 Tax=Belliella baltica (strain DSM 15883 / CIP 108006 / LMG 21964 / BA134) TaxID=866536 RepID=I3Z0R1_BELBD|nr:BT_3928 family protein [Belliella baltica]AFL82829.1 putative membrane protein [Belliella baltica DSM 15883]
MLRNTILFIIRFLVGGLFIFSGLIKVNDPVGTAIKLEEYFDVFSYDIAPFFEYFKGFALEIGVVMVVAEVVLGIMLILGVRLKFTVWALSLMILFFTFLTFYSAYFNKVTDCGCFGDAIKLTPWESFFKDIVLLILIAVLFIFRNKLESNEQAWAAWTVRVSLVLSVVLAITAIRNLPFIDFRAYKEGVNIPQAMQPSAPLEYSYVMTKDGQEFVFDQYPSDESYEFVDMKLKNEDALPKISDFAVWNEEGDFTAEILSGNKAVILVTYLSKINTAHLQDFDEMVAGLQSSNIEVVFVAASSEEEIQTFLAGRNWEITSYQADATVVKTIMRSNPGLMLLKEGSVLKKYHFRNTPSAETIKTLY